jgi:hypothetical protein
MQRGTTDVETRRRLIALTQALNLPVTESSLATFIFSQPMMLLSIFLSVAPLLAAFTFVTVPRLKRRTQAPEEIQGEATPLQESLDDLLVEVETDELAGQAGEKTEEDKKEEEQSEQESDGQSSSGLGDLASLFEEEDTSINVLEAFCKGMPDVSVDELLKIGTDIATRLQQGNAAR